MVNSKFFKNNFSINIKKICEHLEIIQSFSKDISNKEIKGFSHLNDATPIDITAFYNPKYLKDLSKTSAAACLINEEFAGHLPLSTIPLIVKHPYRAQGIVLKLLYSDKYSSLDYSSHAFIHPTAKLGKECTISPFAVIEEEVMIGDYCHIGSHSVIEKGSIIGNNCIIHSHVTVSHTIIGNNVFIKTGARLGQKGFGFHMDALGHFDIPQLGAVIIGDDTHIGANTTIDRGSFSDTVIGKGVRIDNLVQIAHNVKVGDNSVLVAQVGIAGSTELGKFVIAAGQVGIAEHLKISDGARIGAQSGLMRDIIKPGETVAGSPAVPVRDWHKQTIALQRLIKGK